MGPAVKELEETPEMAKGADDVENIRRLVRLQSEIVDLARRNSQAERDYRSLRRDVETAFQRQHRSCVRRLLVSLLNRFRRLKRINGAHASVPAVSGNGSAPRNSGSINRKP
jgi:hypothetical protein